MSEHHFKGVTQIAKKMYILFLTLYWFEPPLVIGLNKTASVADQQEVNKAITLFETQDKPVVRKVE